MKEIYSALRKFQDECPVIRKEANNPHYKSNYASLPQILSVITPILSKHGLLILQPVNNDHVVTKLVHIDTLQEIECIYDIVCRDNTNPQQIGSAISYARRYAISSLLNLNIDDDDDGNASSGVNDKKPAPKKEVVKEPLTLEHPNWGKCVTFVKGGGNISDLNKKYTISVDVLKELSKHLHNEQD